MLILVPAIKVPALKRRLPLIFKVAGAVKLPVVSVRFCAVSVVVLQLTLNNVPAVLVSVT